MRLSQIPNIVGLKDAAGGDIGRGIMLMRSSPSGIYGAVTRLNYLFTFWREGLGALVAIFMRNRCREVIPGSPESIELFQLPSDLSNSGK